MKKSSILAGTILVFGCICIDANAETTAIPTESVALGGADLHEQREHRDKAEEEGADRREKREAHRHQRDPSVGVGRKLDAVDRVDLLCLLGLGAYLFSVGFFEACWARTRNERLLGCGAFILGWLLLLFPIYAYAAIN